MKLIAGVDIGNSTTETCIAAINEDGKFKFLSSAITETTGMKGTVENVKGIIKVLNDALSKINKKINDLDVIRINEAAPVIGDTAMETITETIITDSAMIGHNPSTPGGEGLGVGITIDITELDKADSKNNYIVIVPDSVTFDKAAELINRFSEKVNIKGAIIQADEAVLVENRINIKIPIVDEVKHIDRIKNGVMCAIEVASLGNTIKMLSNPFGIASIFNLTPEETKFVVPIAKSLIGNRSAVVIRTPSGEVKESIISAGTLTIFGQKNVVKVNVDSGADEIMRAVNEAGLIYDVSGEIGTNIGAMINRIKNSMANLTNMNVNDIKIKDILAVDTMLPVNASGGIAGETFMEKAVAIASMVKVDRLPMMKIAEKLQNETGVYVKIAGVEAVMASLGALTTPGTKLPIAVLDIGGGSTDAALLDEKGNVTSIHVAGAGELVTMLINSELGLCDRVIAEEIKKNSVAKVESLFHIRVENGQIKFFDEPLNPKLFGRVVVIKGNELIPINKDTTLEKVVQVRKTAKERVFVRNSIRALRAIAPEGNLKKIPNVVIVGGSALDFEVPEMILAELAKYKIVAGRGNIRKSEGPRNAVATGLTMSYF